MDEKVKEVIYEIEEYIKDEDKHCSEPMLTSKDLEILMEYIDSLRLKLNKITEIVRHKPAKTSDYVINYQSAMAQIESIIYILKGLD